MTAFIVCGTALPILLWMIRVECRASDYVDAVAATMQEGCHIQ